jgi:hypothetical protein
MARSQYDVRWGQRGEEGKNFSPVSCARDRVVTGVHVTVCAESSSDSKFGAHP